MVQRERGVTLKGPRLHASPAAPRPANQPPALLPARLGAAGCSRGPAPAALGPERPESAGAVCGARERSALHAPRRASRHAPIQPGARTAAAARAEPGRGPRP